MSRKNILKLLHEKEVVSKNLASFKLINHNTIGARIVLFNRLFAVEAELKQYSEREIKLALASKSQQEKIYKYVVLHEEVEEHENDPHYLLRLVIFSMLLNAKPSYRFFLMIALGTLQEAPNKKKQITTIIKK